jgi:hypothetical protein
MTTPKPTTTTEPRNDDRKQGRKNKEETSKIKHTKHTMIKKRNKEKGSRVVKRKQMTMNSSNYNNSRISYLTFSPRRQGCDQEDLRAFQ